VNGGMQAVGSFVADLTGKAFARYGFASAGLLTDWAAIAGADLAACTRPERLRWPRHAREDRGPPLGATLVLRVEGARALEVQFRAAQIVARINAYFGYAAIAALRLVQGPVGGPVEEPSRPVAAPAASADAPSNAGNRPARRAGGGAPPEHGARHLPHPAGELGGIAAPLQNALLRLGASVRQGRSQPQSAHRR
jgi:hypothetical protein